MAIDTTPFEFGGDGDGGRRCGKSCSRPSKYDVVGDIFFGKDDMKEYAWDGAFTEKTVRFIETVRRFSTVNVKRSSEPLSVTPAVSTAADFTQTIYFSRSHTLIRHILILESERSINGLFPFECSLPKSNGSLPGNRRAESKEVSRLVSVMQIEVHCSHGSVIIILDSSFHSLSSSISSLCDEPMDNPDIQIYVLAEESRTTNSYVIEFCSDNREGKNKAVVLDEVIAWATEKQFVLSLRLVGFSHLLGILV
ncbi:hypothetical protein SDJN03_05409, partial [Cucurbita argyrosperma subsp. sororia]